MGNILHAFQALIVSGLLQYFFEPPLWILVANEGQPAMENVMISLVPMFFNIACMRAILIWDGLGS